MWRRELHPQTHVADFQLTASQQMNAFSVHCRQQKRRAVSTHLFICAPALIRNSNSWVRLGANPARRHGLPYRHGIEGEIVGPSAA